MQQTPPEVRPEQRPQMLDGAALSFETAAARSIHRPEAGQHEVSPVLTEGPHASARVLPVGDVEATPPSVDARHRPSPTWQGTRHTLTQALDDFSGSRGGSGFAG